MKIQVNTRNVRDVYPLMSVSGGVAISRKGALTVGWELSLPVSYSVSEGGYDDMQAAMASAIRLLPAWSVVHRQDTYFLEDWKPDSPAASGDFLGACSDAHFRGRRYLVHRAYLFVTMAGRGLVEKKGSRSGLFGLGRDVHVPSPERWGEFRARCDEFIGVLTRGGLVGARELTDADWLGEGADVGIVQKVMMLGGSGLQMSDIRMTPDAVGVYDRTAVSYVIGEAEALPTSISTAARVDALSTPASEVTLSYASRVGVLLDCEHIVNQYIVVPVQDEVLGQLDRERRKMFSGARNSADNRINCEEVTSFLDEVYKEGLFVVQSHMNVIAWGPDSAVQAVRGRVSSAMSAMGCVNVFNSYNTPVLYYAAIPGCGFELGTENLMKMELRSALTLAAWETFPRSVPGGVLRLCDRMRHIPLALDTQMAAASAGWIGNYNMFVLGVSGTGKSFFMNNYLRCCYARGQSVFLIDVGDSYQGLCGVIRELSGGRDGAYLSWDREHPFSFACFPDIGLWLKEGGGLNTDESSVSFFLSFLQTAYTPGSSATGGGWTSASSAVLTQIVEDFVAWVRDTGAGNPVFDDFFRFVGDRISPRITYVAPTVNPDGSRRAEDAVADDGRRNGYWVGSTRITPSIFDVDRFCLALRSYAKDGSYGFLLNDPHPADLFNGRFTVFEVDRLSKDDPKFYSLCVLCIVNAMERRMRMAPGFKNIVIEEAWAAIANETMAPYLRSLWKTARKFSTSAVVVTQEVEDIISNSEIKTAILDNSDVKVLLDQSNHLNTFDRLSDLLSLTPMDRNLVLSIGRGMDRRYRYREAFIKLGSRVSAVYGVEVSPEEAFAYESNKEKKAPLYARAAECGSVVQSIREFASKMRESAGRRV